MRIALIQQFAYHNKNENIRKGLEAMSQSAPPPGVNTSPPPLATPMASGTGQDRKSSTVSPGA